MLRASRWMNTCNAPTQIQTVSNSKVSVLGIFIGSAGSLRRPFEKHIPSWLFMATSGREIFWFRPTAGPFLLTLDKQHFEKQLVRRFKLRAATPGTLHQKKASPLAAISTRWVAFFIILQLEKTRRSAWHLILTSSRSRSPKLSARRIHSFMKRIVALWISLHIASEPAISAQRTFILSFRILTRFLGSEHKLRS